MKAKYSIWLCSLVVLMLISSCGSPRRYEIAVDNVEPVHVARFDSLICRYVDEPDSARRNDMKAATGYFWGIYNYRLLRLRDVPDFYEGLSAFLSDSVVSQIYADALESYADMSGIEEELSMISARYLKLFPHGRKYIFQSHISALKMPVVTMDSLISVSIDCYLGADYPLYRERYNAYELPVRASACLLPDVGEVMLRNTIPAPQNSLLEYMIYEGIVAHLLAGLLDDASVATVLHYTPEQEAWCVENEEKIWSTIVERGDLFTYDRVTIGKYINPAPFTSTINQESPARIGRWVGWRIVQQYMQREGLTVEDLAADTTPFVEILRLSNYNAR